MPVTVSDAGPYEKLVAFTVPQADIDAASTATARRISRDLRIPGFRPGKAPRPIVERTVGAARLRAETIDDMLPERVASLLAESELEPAVSPALESLDDGVDGVDVTVRVTLWPTLATVPEYKGRSVVVESPEVTDEEIADQIDRMRAQFGSLEEKDGAAEEGDYATIDISATADGREIEEARASALVYQIGSGGFLDGIDEALIGATAGEVRTFDGVLPEGFGDAARSEVTFDVEVTTVRRLVLPELTDEWIAENSEFASVSELEVNLEERMSVLKRQSAARSFRANAVDELVDQIDIQVPEALVRSEMEEIVHRFVHRLEREEISIEDYLEASGITQDAFLDDARSQAERGIRTRLLLEAIAREEEIEVEPDEIEAVIAGVFGGIDPETRRRLRDGGGEQTIAGDILRNKALDRVLLEATPVDEDGDPVDLEIEEPDEPAAGIPVDDEGAQGGPGDAVVVAAEIADDASGEVVPAGIPLDDEPDIAEDAQR